MQRKSGSRQEDLRILASTTGLICSDGGWHEPAPSSRTRCTQFLLDEDRLETVACSSGSARSQLLQEMKHEREPIALRTHTPATFSPNSPPSHFWRTHQIGSPARHLVERRRLIPSSPLRSMSTGSGPPHLRNGDISASRTIAPFSEDE